jgi:hypothetical protein
MFRLNLLKQFQRKRKTNQGKSSKNPKCPNPKALKKGMTKKGENKNLKKTSKDPLPLKKRNHLVRLRALRV